MTTWAVLTGEYPPQPGGVADYTRQVCRGLVAAGDRVTVFAPPWATEGSDTGVTVVRLPDHFGRRGRAAVGRWVRGHRPDRVLIQYVPHAFGRRAMNLPFAGWVRFRLKALAPVWVTFHEVAFPFVRRPWQHNLIAVANRLMARLLADAADRVFVTIPAWGDLLRRLAPRGRAAEWLPVPSTLPTAVDATAPRASPGVRVGHFGTYGASVTALLGPALVALLGDHPDRVAVLIGRNGPAFRERFVGSHPELGDRVNASGELPPEATAEQIAACDLLVQPYPDGVSCRRTSVMSALALGVPVVTNLGRLSEHIWAREENGVFLAANPDPGDLAREAEHALAQPAAERLARGHLGRRWYDARFAAARTVAALRGGAS